MLKKKTKLSILLLFCLLIFFIIIIFLIYKKDSYSISHTYKPNILNTYNYSPYKSTFLKAENIDIPPTFGPLYWQLNVCNNVSEICNNTPYTSKEIFGLNLDKEGIFTLNNKPVYKQEFKFSTYTDFYILSFYTDEKKDFSSYCFFNINVSNYSIIYGKVNNKNLENLKNLSTEKFDNPILAVPIAQIKICGTLPLAGKSEIQKNKLGAVFNESILWEQGKRIYVKFMEIPNSLTFPRTYKPNAFLPAWMKKTFYDKDDNGYPMTYDPLEKDMNTTSTSIIDNIIEIVKNRIEPIVNLNFTFLTPDFDSDIIPDIRLSFDTKGGCISPIGTKALDTSKYPIDEPNMNLGWFDVGTTIHEFLHVIGMVHEHQSYKAVGKIQWNRECSFCFNG
jgi:hypothetical protein